MSNARAIAKKTKVEKMTLTSGKIRLAVATLLVFLLAEASVFALSSSSVNIPSTGTISYSAYSLVSGLPSANVYVVANASAGKYVVLSGSNPNTVLETDTDPVVAVTHALSKWCPTNGKLVTNGTFKGWYDFYAPRGNFTWEGWKTVLNGTHSIYRSVLIFPNGYSHMTFDNLTLKGNNIILYGIADYGWSGNNYITVTHCRFYNFTGGVYITNVNNWTIDYCNFTYCHDPNYQMGVSIYVDGGYTDMSHDIINCAKIVGTMGILDGGIGHNTMEHDTIVNWNSGGHPNTHAIYAYGPYDEIAYNYLFTDFSASTQEGSCCLHLKAPHIYVHDNIINVTGAEEGISTYNESVTPGGPVGERVINNTFIQRTDSYTSGYGTIGMAIGGGGFNSAGCQNMIITKNTFKGDWGTDMLIWAPTYANTLYNDSVYNNVFENGHAGINIGDWSYNSYPTDYSRDVYIYNNTFKNLGQVSNTGEGWCPVTIEVHKGTSNIQIHDNAFSNCTTPLSSSIIDCYEGDSNLLTSSKIYNNTGLQTGSYPFYMLNVSIVGSGTTSPYGLGWQYVKGTVVPVTWTPNSGYNRVSFTVDGVNSGTTSPVSVTMSANHVCIATFT